MPVCLCEIKYTRCETANKSHNGGGVNAMRGGIRYQVIIAANSLIGSVILWAVLLSIGGIIATVLLQ